MAKLLTAAALAGMLAAGGGCVAFNVGEPEVFSHTETVVTTKGTPIRTEVLSVEAKAQADGNRLSAWLEADVREKFQRWGHNETVTVKKQKRLAVGLYPSGASVFLGPKNTLSTFPAGLMRTVVKYPGPNGNQYVPYSQVQTNGRGAFHLGQGGYALYWFEVSRPKNYYVVCQLAGLLGLGIPAFFGSIDTLLIEPFSGGGWQGTQEVVDPENVKHIGYLKFDTRLQVDASGAPKIQALNKFSPSERTQMGVLTCYDVHIARQKQTFGFGYFGLLGVYKYITVAVEGPVRDEIHPLPGTEAKRRTENMPGPYEVALKIPLAGISTKTTVGAGDRKATFSLPQVEQEGQYEATLEFRSLYTGTVDAVRKAWNTRTLKKTVRLEEKPKPKSVVMMSGFASPPVAQSPAPVDMEALADEVARKLQRDEQARRPTRAYDVNKATVAGRTIWRVAILDEHLNAFAVDREVKGQILQELRDDFAGRNPEVPRGEINAWATYTTEDGGRTLVYVGVAESLIPELESLEYSEETHRGTVRMGVRAGADLRRSKEFVRQNISAIVCDKNVLVKAGERPPDGATYRSLDENFADGMLTVEFEAVE